MKRITQTQRWFSIYLSPTLSILLFQSTFSQRPTVILTISKNMVNFYFYTVCSLCKRGTFNLFFYSLKASNYCCVHTATAVYTQESYRLLSSLCIQMNKLPNFLPSEPSPKSVSETTVSQNIFQYSRYTYTCYSKISTVPYWKVAEKTQFSWSFVPQS